MRATSLIDSMIQLYKSTNGRFYLSYDITIVLKSYFGLKTLGCA